jgi:hypothetical protein
LFFSRRLLQSAAPASLATALGRLGAFLSLAARLLALRTPGVRVTVQDAAVGDRLQQLVAPHARLLQEEGAETLGLVQQRNEDVPDVDDLLGGGLAVEQGPSDHRLEADRLHGLGVLDHRHPPGKVLLHGLLDLVGIRPARLEDLPGCVKKQSRIQYVLGGQELVLPLLGVEVRRL